MSCPACFTSTTNGQTGDASPDSLAIDVTTTDATPQIFDLVSLPANGSRALIRLLQVFATRMDNPNEGSALDQWVAVDGAFVRSAAGGSVIINGPRSAPAAPAVVWAFGIPAGGGGVALGYAAPAAFGAPALAATLTVVANALRLTLTGLAGITAQWKVRGSLECFSGAIKLR